jgi:multidrug efflux pump subunit AcrA (membrane-fusion protein)
MKQKIILWSSISGAVLLLLVCYFLFIRNGKIKYDFRLDTVSQGDITVYVTATGTINPVKFRELSQNYMPISIRS